MLSVPKPDPLDKTYSVRAVARLSGLSPELMRAWERRYAVVEPLRTEGGTRRYRASDLERLRLLKAAVAAGHRIGRVAKLDAAELARLAAPTERPSSSDGLEAILSALERLDAEQVQRLLSLQLFAMGPVRFARELALPLVREIGERWASERLGIASEHLASGVLRSLLGSALTPTFASRLGPRIVFATPSGERHELGLQMAALTALGAGATPIYLGAELPVEDMLEAVGKVDAEVLALSLVVIPTAQAQRTLRALRGGLPHAVRIWIGGAGAAEVETPDGVERIASHDELEQRIALLEFEKKGAR